MTRSPPGYRSRMSPRAPVVAGLLIERRNDWIRHHIAGCNPGRGYAVDLGAGQLNRQGLVGGLKYLANDIRPVPGVDLVASGLQLPFPDGSIAVVMGLELLEHVKEPLAVLEEARRVLRPGGYCYFSVPSTFPRHSDADYWRFTSQGLSHLAAKAFPDSRVLTFGDTFESLAVLGGYYLQLIAHRYWSPGGQLVPVLERAGYALDRRVPWARSDTGLHTLKSDLLLVASA